MQSELSKTIDVADVVSMTRSAKEYYRRKYGAGGGEYLL